MVACTPAARAPAAEPRGFEDGEAALLAVRVPADVTRLCDGAKRAIGGARDAALAPGLDAMGTIRAVEKLDRVISIANQTADTVGNIHPDAPVRDAARACTGALNGMQTEIFAGQLVPRIEGLHGLPPTEQAYAARIVASAKVAGAGLSPDATKKFVELQEREAKLVAELAEAMSSPATPLVVDAARLAGTPPDFIASHPPDARGKVSIDPVGDWRPIAAYATDRALATEALRGQHATAASKTATLRELLETRLAEARLLGCDAYAECQARIRMVGTRARTQGFLRDFMAIIHDLEPPYLAALGLSPGERPPEADLRYIETRARARLGLPDTRPYHAYFETEPTLDRILAALGEGMGLRFAPITVATWAPEVRVFDVFRGERRVARFFFDLYARPGKIPFSGSTYLPVPHTPGLRGEPVTAVISIGAPHSEPGRPSRLWPAGFLKLLVHETGHAIDFTFETSSQLAAPEPDFFDVPSQLLESLVEDPAFLQRIGREGTKPLPREGADAIVTELRWDDWKNNRELAAITEIDLAYHGDHVPDDLLAVYADAFDRVRPTRTDRENHPEISQFMPVVVYAGNGHGLPWGFAIAADLAGAFPHGLSDPVTWARLFDEVFGVDGPADERIARFLGRPWNLERLRRRLSPPLQR